MPVRDQDYTFFWQGKDPVLLMYSVSFAVRNSLVSATEPPTRGSKCISSLNLSSSYGSFDISSIYGPRLCSCTQDKDQFYKDLNSAVGGVPVTEELSLLGGFTALVGSNFDFWPICIWHFGIRNIDENGQWLLVLCLYYNLCITGTFFFSNPWHQVSWKHPWYCHWHQLDLVTTRRSSLNYILTTCSSHSADCDTVYSLTASKVQLWPKWVYCSKTYGQICINTAKTTVPDLCK